MGSCCTSITGFPAPLRDCLQDGNCVLARSRFHKFETILSYLPCFKCLEGLRVMVTTRLLLPWQPTEPSGWCCPNFRSLKVQTPIPNSSLENPQCCLGYAQRVGGIPCNLGQLEPSSSYSWQKFYNQHIFTTKHAAATHPYQSSMPGASMGNCFSKPSTSGACILNSGEKLNRRLWRKPGRGTSLQSGGSKCG